MNFAHRLLFAALVPALAVALPAAAQTGATPVGDAASPATGAKTMVTDAAGAALDAALAGSWRTPANVARDPFRHPKETLGFFLVKPDQTVIEVTPGAGWYSEILAPYLREKGTYVAAIVDPASQPEGRARDYYAKSRDELRAKLTGEPTGVYGRPTIVEYDPKAPVFGRPGSADVVLTFRNVHNWRSGGYAEAMFKGFFDVLKPGGTLGVVEHRAKADVPADDRSGYVGEAQVIAMAKAAGFVLDGKSEINANPKDTRDHPNGVWTLPPVNRHDAADAAKYKAIGESDRMTLRFRKP